MSEEKKTDAVTALLQKKADQTAQAVKEYSLVDAVQILNRITLDAMVTKATAREAIREADFLSNASRTRVGVAIQALGINLPALSSALDEGDKLRKRG